MSEDIEKRAGAWLLSSAGQPHEELHQTCFEFAKAIIDRQPTIARLRVALAEALEEWRRWEVTSVGPLTPTRIRRIEELRELFALADLSAIDVIVGATPT